MSLPPTYLDTSFLVKFWLAEDGVEPVRRVLYDRVRSFATSEVTAIEIASAVGRRVREGDLDPAAADELLHGIYSDCGSLAGAGRLVFLRADHGVIHRAVFAVRQCANGVVPVRTLDAIHLATALVAGSTHFVTADARQGRAAEVLGLNVEQA